VCARLPFSSGLPFFPLSTAPHDNPTHTTIIHHGIHVPNPVQLPPVLSLSYSGVAKVAAARWESRPKIKDGGDKRPGKEWARVTRALQIAGAERDETRKHAEIV
jgi:hypothetical protein